MKIKLTRKEIKVLETIRFNALSAAEIANKLGYDVLATVRKLDDRGLIMHSWGSVDANLYYRYDITAAGIAVIIGKGE